MMVHLPFNLFPHNSQCVLFFLHSLQIFICLPFPGVIENVLLDNARKSTVHLHGKLSVVFRRYDLLYPGINGETVQLVKGKKLDTCRHLCAHSIGIIGIKHKPKAEGVHTDEFPGGADECGTAGP